MAGRRKARRVRGASRRPKRAPATERTPRLARTKKGNREGTREERQVSTLFETLSLAWAGNSSRPAPKAKRLRAASGLFPVLRSTVSIEGTPFERGLVMPMRF